jgi:hypothetical protein
MMINSSSKQLLYLSISNSNQSISDKKESITKKNGCTNNSFKKSDPIKALMEQKQKIADSKQKYLDGALKKNESEQSIKGKLAEYDKQISEIDKQMSELKLEEQKKHLGTEEKNKEKENDKVKNNLDESNSQGKSIADKGSEMINNLLNISNNMSLTKVVSALKVSESGEKRVLDGEIKLDEGRGIDPIGKKKRVAKIEDNIEKIEKTIEEKLNPNILDDNINNVVNKNKEIENSAEKKSVESSAEPVKNVKILETIKNYKKNNDYKAQENGQKLNSIA